MGVRREWECLYFKRCPPMLQVACDVWFEGVASGNFLARRFGSPFLVRAAKAAIPGECRRYRGFHRSCTQTITPTDSQKNFFKSMPVYIDAT